MTTKILEPAPWRRCFGLRGPIVAHHSVSAEFDTTKTINFTGTVKEINWGNPHIYTVVDATDPRYR